MRTPIMGARLRKRLRTPMAKLGWVDKNVFMESLTREIVEKFKLQDRIDDLQAMDRDDWEIRSRYNTCNGTEIMWLERPLVDAEVTA